MKLPPMNGLRAFDAAARRLSVRLAAEELFVTPAAVSQQIKLLESHLGVRLFSRGTRAIRLTEAGSTFHQATTRHLRAIAAAAERVRPGDRVVNVSTLPTFAARWLVQRLPGFTSLHPTVEVRLEASPALVDLADGSFDLGVREGTGQQPGTDTRLLFEQAMIPVGQPVYLRKVFGKGGPGWGGARLLHEANNEFWPQWLEMAGIAGVDTSHGLYFSHGMLALTAAGDGQGIALSPRFLVESDLRKGLLEVVDARELATGRGYYLAWAKPAVRALPVAAAQFRDWLIDEVQREVAGPRP
jgi:LysR family glycine cleavage system transcriptional activator